MTYLNFEICEVAIIHYTKIHIRIILNYNLIAKFLKNINASITKLVVVKHELWNNIQLFFLHNNLIFFQFTLQTA